jgi:hypothetical protein
MVLSVPPNPPPSAPSTMPDCSDQKIRLNGAPIALGAACGMTGPSVKALP